MRRRAGQAGCAPPRRDPRRGLIDTVENVAGCQNCRVHRTDPVVGGVTGLRAVICAVAGFRHHMVWRSKPLVHLGVRVPNKETHMVCRSKHVVQLGVRVPNRETPNGHVYYAPNVYYDIVYRHHCR